MMKAVGTKVTVSGTQSCVRGRPSVPLCRRTVAARCYQTRAPLNLSRSLSRTQADGVGGVTRGAGAGGRAQAKQKRGAAFATKAIPDDVDWVAVRGYLYATVIQFGLIAATLRALDFVFPKIAFEALGKITLFGVDAAAWPAKAKSVAVFFFFLFMSLRSRIFSPLDNRRPTLSSETKEMQERKRPGWMPPPLAFPIIWSTIAILRATSSLLVWKALGGKFLVAPLTVFLGHLCIGDTWNSINNVDKEYGVATLSMLFVVSSVYVSCYGYFQVSKQAGLVLLPSCIWISIASFLVFSIWRLNGKPSLYPKRSA